MFYVHLRLLISILGLERELVYKALGAMTCACNGATLLSVPILANKALDCLHAL